MLADILKIAILCILIGGASIPVSFGINSSPLVVWLGNATGSLFSAVAVIYILNRLVSDKFKARISRSRVGKKIIITVEEGGSNTHVQKAQGFINRHGLRLFSLVCPIFPGVLISSVAVYVLGLDKKLYRKWMFAGVVFVSGAYVLGYWWAFVK